MIGRGFDGNDGIAMVLASADVVATAIAFYLMLSA